MTLTLSLVRHGQTEFNVQQRLQGWCDSPLTAPGLAGVRTTAAQLADRPFVAAYVSPSGRARATAREILALHPPVPVVVDPDLREFHFGDFEEQPESALLERYNPARMYAQVLAGTFAGLPGGEAGATFFHRVTAVFARIERRHDHGNVLVVSHGLTLRAYLSVIDPRPMYPLPNASVSSVEVHADGRHRVVALAVDYAGHGAPAEVDSVPVPELAS
ncbi:histidine phosphatase family protein [Pengzhenrongella sicca]|uniref:Histidine phosphatase family protein n=1 Tax=Pengzhenrongella sicca TaxID=2819238 RepID=A0A8A4ZLX0_9MICO|nr:histidine phosphatase family protein [Pengzhenrongella sicca]